MAFSVGAGLLLATFPLLALSCSYAEVKSPDDGWVIGRTMELGSGGGRRLTAMEGPVPDTPPIKVTWEVVLHPRGEKIANFTNQYGFVGLDASLFGVAISSDGLNEAGLSVSAHTMRMAEYEKPEPHKRQLYMLEVVPWILGQYDSVQSAMLGMANVSVISGIAPDEYFVHWALADAHGNSAVLEYDGGQRIFHQNDVRVMTNDPDYLWHVKNLNMYVGLSPQAPLANEDIEVKTQVGMVPKVWSQGFNLAALPGDFSPASRFVRLFYLRQYAALHDPVHSVDDAIVLMTALLNNVFIPRGAVAPMKQASSILDFDYTQFAVVKIPAQKRLLFRDYRDMTWRQVDLNKLNFTSQTRSMLLSTGGVGIQDVTAKLQSPKAEASENVV